MTHSHPLDFDITAAALQRDAFQPSSALIGSETKRARFTSAAPAEIVGIPDDRIDGLVCPIGIADPRQGARGDCGGDRRASHHREGAGVRTTGQPGNAAGVSVAARHRQAVSASTRSTSARACPSPPASSAKP